MLYIQTEKSPYFSWYVGIASNPHNRLFQEHNIEMDFPWWVICKARNSEEARIAEKLIIEKHRTDGGSGGGDEKSIYVYAYKKTETTKP
jgi:hypothetical protein